MSHCNIYGFSCFMQSHLIVLNPFTFRMSFLTSILITNHDLMFSVIIYPFNALNYSLRFMRHTVTIDISHLCVTKKISQVVFCSKILIEYVEMTMLWYNNMIWWWYWLSYQQKSVFLQEKCYSVTISFKGVIDLGGDPIRFLLFLVHALNVSLMNLLELQE